MFKSMLELCIGSIIKVTNTQLNRYITGELSEVTEEVLSKTKASTPHNVWAERALGMYDAIQHRNKQAKPTHIETKCQLSTNKTLDWLNSHPVDQQEKLILHAVKYSSVLRKTEREREEWLKTEAERRLVLKAQARDEKSRRQFSTKIAQVLKNGDAGGLDIFPEFVELDQRQKEVAIGMINKNKMKGVEFEHAYDEDDGTTVKWEGIFIKQTKRASGLLTYHVRYWIPGFREEAEKEDDQYTLMAEKVLCDLFMGDLRFH